jgi:hypothetical protein
MGTQQMLYVILGVILIGIAMVIGLSLFVANGIQSNKDEMIHDLNNITQYAYAYKIRLKSLGGGGNSYQNYTLPVQLKSNDNATYTIQVPGTATGITFRGTSLSGNGYIDAIVDDNGVPAIDDSNFNN